MTYVLLLVQLCIVSEICEIKMFTKYSLESCAYTVYDGRNKPDPQ